MIFKEQVKIWFNFKINYIIKRMDEKRKITQFAILKYRLGRLFDHYFLKIKEFIKHIYYFLKINEVVFFIQFIFHRYSIKQFSLDHLRHNFHVILQSEPDDGIAATRKGKLIRLTSAAQKKAFILKNVLLFGALQARVEKAIYYTIVAWTIEIYNPFDKEVLAAFLERKVHLVDRLLKKARFVNGRRWNQSGAYAHLQLFKRNSILQEAMIERMHRAVRKQKVPKIIKDAQEALKKGLHPLLITTGCSGAYWMRSTEREVAGLFKPFDEEIHAPNNPIGPVMQGAMGQVRTRLGIRVGEAAHREVAAFLVDQFFHFGIVPKTYYATFTHQAFYSSREDRFSRRIVKKKYGSFQEYIEGFLPAYKMFDRLDRVPLEEFQLLVLLDVIVGNTDRHLGNVLVGEDKIAAIDHGLIFSDCHDSYSYRYWDYFPQGKEKMRDVFVEFLKTFPYAALAQKLNYKCDIQLPCLHRMRERVALFLEGILAGHPPVDLIGLMQREFLQPLRYLEETLQTNAKEIVSTYVPFIPEKER